MKKLKQYLRKHIEDHMIGLDIDELDMNDFSDPEDVLDAMDVESLLDVIVGDLQNRILTFTPTSKLDTADSLTCSRCFKTIGVWKSPSGQELSDGLVTASQKRIIIIDDF